MEIRNNEIKSQLLNKKSLLLTRTKSENYDTIKPIIDIIDWLLNTFCNGDYVILDINKLDFSLDIEEKHSRAANTKITMNVIAGHQTICTRFTKEDLSNNEDLKEQIKNYAIAMWMYYNAF